MIGIEHDLVAVIAKVSDLARDHGIRIGKQAGLGRPSVTTRITRQAELDARSVRVGSGDGYLVEWYIELETVLESIAGLPGVTGLGAEYALRRHRAGQGTPVKVHPD